MRVVFVETSGDDSWELVTDSSEGQGDDREGSSALHLLFDRIMKMIQ
jgi:hypothetical protein